MATNVNTVGSYGVATIDLKADTAHLVSVLRVIAKHVDACAAELAAINASDGEES